MQFYGLQNPRKRKNIFSFLSINIAGNFADMPFSSRIEAPAALTFNEKIGY